MAGALLVSGGLLLVATGCSNNAASVNLDVATYTQGDKSGMFSSALIEGRFAVERACLVFEPGGERYVPVFP